MGSAGDGVADCAGVGEVTRGNESAAGRQTVDDRAGKRPAGGEREGDEYDVTRATILTLGSWYLVSKMRRARSGSAPPCSWITTGESVSECRY